MVKSIEVEFKKQNVLVINGATRTVAYKTNISLGCGGIVFNPPEKGRVSAVRKTGTGKVVPFPSTFEVGKSYIIRSKGPPVRR